MKVNGIIAEYNPFHNGHKYQLEEARTALSADYTVVVMSGSFVQRGAPALLNKYLRAEMALRCGADLVLELPVYYAASSAEYFAAGAVSLLDKLGVVNHLCFGSECGNLNLLQKTAEILVQEPEGYRQLLQEQLRRGIPFPAAREEALALYTAALNAEQNVPKALASPNDILGIEYLKALITRDSSIKPYTTLRKGSAYHDDQIGQSHCSAQAIRQLITGKYPTGISLPAGILPEHDAGQQTAQGLELLASKMPSPALEILKHHLETLPKGAVPMTANALSSALHYKLLSEQHQGFSKYLDVTEDLSRRICSKIYQFESFETFAAQLKSRELTYTRISRCLLHILLNITKDSMNACKELDDTPYARVLGFRREASPLLGAIKENAGIPLITSLAEARRSLLEAYPQAALAQKAWEMLQREITISSIYEGAAAILQGKPMQNEYRQPLVIV